MTRKEALTELLAASAEKVKAMSPAERKAMYRAQRHSFARAEAGFGTDQDEAAYRRAVDQGDNEEIARLEEEAKQRIRAVEALIAQEGDQ